MLRRKPFLQRSLRRRGQRKLSRIDRSQNRRISQLERGHELSFSDLDQNFTSIGNAGQIANLSLIAVGDTNQDRTGNKIVGKNLMMRLRITKTVATTDAVRIIIFHDKEQHGADAAVLDLFENITDGADTHLNGDTKQRFRIYKDMTVVFSSDGEGTSDIEYRIFNINLRNLPIHFIGTTAADASNGKNNLYIGMIANEDTTKTAVRSFSRLWYSDP